MILLGGTAIGSAAWGAVATRLNIATALDLAASCLVAGLILSLRLVGTCKD